MESPKRIPVKEENKYILPNDEIIEILDDSDYDDDTDEKSTRLGLKEEKVVLDDYPEKVSEDNKPLDEPLMMECQSEEDEAEINVKIEEREAYIVLNEVSNQTSEKDPLAPEEPEKKPSDQQLLEATENDIKIPPKKVFKCVACSFWAHKVSGVSVHYNRIHLEKKNIRCTVCSFRTNEKYSLELHMETNHKDLMKDRYKAQSKSDLNPSGFTCDSCEFNTWQVIDLKHHILRYHPLSYDKYLLCDWCDFLSLDSTTLKNHKMVRHNSQVLNNAVASDPNSQNSLFTRFLCSTLYPPYI